jgi:pyruvate formate-lyase activating enzyme-like uncharacterized protein
MKFERQESRVRAEIEELRATIPGLRDHGSYQATSTGPLVPGCGACTRMAHMSFQLGFCCNAACPFCFLETYHANRPRTDEKYLRQALLKRFQRSQAGLEGVGLSGGEPLLYLPEMEACVVEMRAAKPDLHLWVYTNGILADDEHLRRVRDLGISEIRFNLAATDYSTQVLDNVARARRWFDYTVVEVPSYPPQEDKLIALLPELDRIGIDQLNLQELMVTDANVDRLQGEGYQAGALMSKFFLYGSRKMTYRVMRRCVQERYSFTVNDCSASRFGRK